MSKPYFCAVIGKNFGDEGKGMAVDFLSRRHDKTLVIRHNGGAQSGHTVEVPDKRFVFHELSSGSFRGADTFWTDTYYPDMYKLGEELEDFYKEAGFRPVIYAQPQTPMTIIDDVLVNMAVETARGAGRHGSCGMGIFEAQCRTKAGYGLTMQQLKGMSESQLVQYLGDIRTNYWPERLAQLAVPLEDLGEYGALLQDGNVLENAACQMLENLKDVHIVNPVEAFVKSYDCVIFENGQGLLLDEDNMIYSPHVTASKTGLANPCKLVRHWNQTLDEVIYVTRSYVTRHGAGPLPGECDRSALGQLEEDRTNQKNDWQGSLRYATHEEIDAFTGEIQADLQQPGIHQLPVPKRTLLITHLNETAHQMMCRDHTYDIDVFCREQLSGGILDEIWLSSTRFSKDIALYQDSSAGNR